VVAEVAPRLCFWSAGLMVKGFQGLLSVNESYAPQTLLTLNFSLPEVQYARPAARLNFNEQIVRRLGSVFRGASGFAGDDMSLTADGGAVNEREFSIEGRPLTQRGEVRTPSWR